VQTLILAGNALTSLPDVFASLPELKFIDVKHNAITELPASIGHLPKLEVLNVSHNKLTSLALLLPLTSLVTLLAVSQVIGLSFQGIYQQYHKMQDENEINDLTLSFDKLARLETVSLSHNKLVELPNEVCTQMFKSKSRR
jgi:leucine-rich repeat protein SHOC2